jgi:hypothetical protein
MGIILIVVQSSIEGQGWLALATRIHSQHLNRIKGMVDYIAQNASLPIVLRIRGPGQGPENWTQQFKDLCRLASTHFKRSRLARAHHYRIAGPRKGDHREHPGLL